MTSQPATRELLIEQISRVFIRKGYDGATLTNLAAETGLSKASLYHHFPGGKPEMAAALTRHAIATLQRMAYACLSDAKPPAQRISGFIAGFAAYVEQGQTDCVLAVLIHHGTAREEAMQTLQSDIAAQFNDWHQALANVYVTAGDKPKKAHRRAHELISTLYGSLLNAKMHNQPSLFANTVARMRKQLERSGL